LCRPVANPPNGAEVDGVYCLNVLLPSPAPIYCETDVYNQTHFVLDALATKLGRNPTHHEIVALTYRREIWNDRNNKGEPIPAAETAGAYAREGISRNYYRFCGTDGCTELELKWFLSGYQLWRTGIETINLAAIEAVANALKADLDDYGGEINDPASELYAAASLIISPTNPTWREGIYNDRPWQWFNRLTNITRPNIGTDRTNAVLLRIAQRSFEMYTWCQDQAIKNNPCP
jgi:hypothetical protein